MYIRRKKFQRRIERAINSSLRPSTAEALREVGRTSTAFTVGDFGPEKGEQFETCPLTQAGHWDSDYGALIFAIRFDKQFRGPSLVQHFKVIG